MATVAPRADIVPPSPAPPRVGLLPTVRPISLTRDSAMGQQDAGGFQFAPENCGEVGTADPCESGPKDIGDNLAQVEANAFVIWAGDRCTATGRDRDRAQRARNQLEAGASYAVARELWRGDVARAATPDWPNRYLASADADILTATAGEIQPTSATVALACLEQALGDCAHGARGMIHATRQLATHWQALNLLRREGQLLLTTLDTFVVADAGYDGSGADVDGTMQPAEDGRVWAYATTPVVVGLGAEFIIPDGVASAFDRSVNTEEYRAERLAAADWDGCCHFAVAVDIPLCEVGGLGS